MFRRIVLLTALVYLPGGVLAAPPLVPPPREVAPPRIDPRFEDYRESLLKMQALGKKLEAQRIEEMKLRKETNTLEAEVKRMLAQRATPRPGPPRWMPMVTPEQLRELQGLPPLPRPPVRD